MKLSLDHLSPSSRAWVENILADFALDDSQLPLLRLAGETLDAIEAARVQVEQDGAYFVSETGVLKKHPALGVMQSDKTIFARLCRELALSDSEDSRPPRLNYS